MNMDFDEYQELAARTAGTHFTHNEALCNWAMGMCGEAGEFSEIIKKHVFHGKPLDLDAARKEIGDSLWYCAMAAKALGLSLDDVAWMNIEKLRKRYPDKFTLGGGIRETPLTPSPDSV